MHSGGRGGPTTGALAGPVQARTHLAEVHLLGLHQAGQPQRVGQQHVHLRVMVE